MKTTDKIILFIAVLVIGAGCSTINFKSPTTEISEVVDLTDPLTTKPSVKEIISLFDLSNNIWKGADFRLLYLTNVSYNPLFETKLKAENQWLGNKFDRAKKVKTFTSEVDKIISNSTTASTGKDNSSVYFPIAKELNKLSQSKANTRILLVYSDLMQNNSEISFYDNYTFRLLKTKPEEIKRTLDTHMKLENLQGINIYLIYQPQNTKQDDQYKIVSDFYKKLFESKGAKVEISANLN